ncbi:CBD9-like protein [Tothia fuscella]|uniref:CBD9-like protein n=1 Tax=Tothia fuscella TaxID=1048955 RepID=A0A9P4NN10_9PEZI|nr:CBD9-like protein [Tothia fuscella]
MRTSLISTLLGLGSIAYGQSVSTNQGGIKYAVSVPEQTVNSNKGDMYIQISGPSSNSWMAIGQGSTMSGANMFVIYASGSGTNVTLSPRSGSGHSTPQFNSGSQATLMEGSGISNGVMTANIKCSDCASNGKTKLTGTAQWIYAAKSGSPLNSDDQSASIQQHGSAYGPMSLNMDTAKNAANTNPFTSAGSTTGSTNNCDESQNSGASSTGSDNEGASPTSNGGGFFGGSRPTARPTSFPTGFPGFNNGGGNNNRKRADAACTPTNGGNSGSSTGGLYDINKRNAMLKAHGIMAGLAFAVLFPFGAISIRLLSFPGLVWFHAAFQAFAYLTYIIGFGLGIYIATQGPVKYINDAHPIIGIILFLALFLQPILGWLHHSNFKKFQQRTGFSYAHIWLGRIVIALGIINGGLGFRLAANTAWGPIVYGVVAGIVFLIYVVAIFIGERRRKRNAIAGPPKYDDAMRIPDGGSSPNSGRSMEMGNRGANGAPAAREFYGRRK